jgi:hypothetical protein
VFTADAVNNTSVTNVTDFASVPGGGVLKLLSTQTASASASISFTSGIDSTYDSYVFKFINCHPSNDNQDIQFNASTDGGSNYNVTKTSSTFQTQHDEADTEALIQYNTDRDLAQSTSAQRFSLQIGNDNDQSVVGTLHLFNPSSTTFVKHYLATVQGANASNYTQQLFTGGYMNTTSAVNAIQFSFQSGNIDDGIIKMYGVV